MSAVLKLFKRGIKKRIQQTNEKELTDSNEIVASPVTALDSTQDQPITPEMHAFKKKKNIFHFKFKNSSKVKSSYVVDSSTPNETPRVEEPTAHIEVNESIQNAFDNVDAADLVEEDNNEQHRNESVTEHKCEYCMQVCKSKAGLLAHKRNSKACKIKQTEKKFVTIIQVG